MLRDTEETLINNPLVLAGVGQRNSGALFRRGEGQQRERGGGGVSVWRMLAATQLNPPYFFSFCTSGPFCRPVCATGTDLWGLMGGGADPNNGGWNVGWRAAAWRAGITVNPAHVVSLKPSSADLEGS